MWMEEGGSFNWLPRYSVAAQHTAPHTAPSKIQSFEWDLTQSPRIVANQ